MKNESDTNLLQIYQRILAGYITSIEIALRQGAFEEIASIAHKMKGNAGLYGFSKLSEMSKFLLEYAEQHKKNELTETFEKIKDYIRNEGILKI